MIKSDKQIPRTWSSCYSHYLTLNLSMVELISRGWNKIEKTNKGLVVTLKKKMLCLCLYLAAMINIRQLLTDFKRNWVTLAGEWFDWYLLNFAAPFLKITQVLYKWFKATFSLQKFSTNASYFKVNKQYLPIIT